MQSKDTQHTFKSLAKEAKKRMKSGYWDNFDKELQSKKNLAEDVGVNPSHVAEYYMATTFNEVNGKRSSDEEFYNKVKKLLIEHGEVSNAIGRLVDHDVYDKMNYDQKQRYMLDLSNRYLEALERFRKEKYYCLNEK